MLILLVGCSKTQKEIFEDSLNNIAIYSQELFDYIDKDSNKKITTDEFVVYKKKQDDFYQKNLMEEEGRIYSLVETICSSLMIGNAIRERTILE